MATRSTIAVENLDGSVSVVYCHFDGYLSNNGRILQEHYTDRSKVSCLMQFGDLSSLGKNIGNSDGTYRTKDDCVFYGRDGQESDTECRIYESFDDYLNGAESQQYNYILRKVNGLDIWFVQFHETEEKFLALTEALAKETV